jgi:phosphoglycerate dehydrogenase-like enzyme
MMNVLYLGPTLPEYTDVIESLLPAGFHLRIVHADSPDLWERIREADFLVSFVWITKDMIQAVPKLKLIQSITAGYDKIDVEAAARAGIPVATTSGANAVSVAEHIFATILALSHHIVYAHNAVKEGKWPQLELFKGKCFELSGKTIGLVGFGQIGQAAAGIARAFGMEVLYYRRHRLSPEEESRLEAGYAPLESLLQLADIVSIQVPRTLETEGLLGRAELSLMKKSALLINTARGGIVDEEALIDCLVERRIAGAGLDVFAQEPINPESRLLQMDNVVLTPHTAGAAWESVRRTLEVSVENILRVASGERPRNLVLPIARGAETNTP